MKRILLPVAVATLFITACNKDYNTGTSATYSSMDDVFDQLEVKAKVVTIDASAGGSFYGNSGTRYLFPPASLQDESGQPVTGNVQVSVAEYTQKGDMIFSRALPVADGEPLISGGEINVTAATPAGKNVFLRPGKTFSAHIPRSGDTTSGMQLFMGIPMVGNSGTKVNWVPKADTAKAPVKIEHYGDTLKIISDSLKMCNADKFMKQPIVYQSFTVTIKVTNASISNWQDLHTYAIYDNQKAIWQFNIFASNNVYTEHHVPSIPVHLVSFVLISGRFYAGVTAATPKTGENYTVTLTEVDAKAFKASLSQY